MTENALTAFLYFYFSEFIYFYVRVYLFFKSNYNFILFYFITATLHLNVHLNLLYIWNGCRTMNVVRGKSKLLQFSEALFCVFRPAHNRWYHCCLALKSRMHFNEKMYIVNNSVSGRSTRLLPFTRPTPTCSTCSPGNDVSEGNE